MYDSSSIRDRVIKVISEQLGIPNAPAITDEKSITSDLGADSLDEIELIIALEDEFDIEITDEEAEKCTSVSEVVSVITNRIGK